MSGTGLHSWSQTANNNGTADSAISWPEGMAPSAVNDSARGMMSVLAKYRDDTAGTITTDGSSTAYTASPSTTFASFSELNGQVLYLKMHTTSGATPTLNVNALGAKNIKSVSGTNIATGYLLEGGIYAFTYSSANNEFVVHGTPGALSGLATLTVSGAVSTGALTAGGLLTVSSGGAAITGNTSITGTLSASGNFAINTDKFTVAAASGNTAIAGTLAITGATTAADITSSGAISGATAAGNMLATQAEQEAGSATNKLVVPGRQHYHLSAAKAWVSFAGSNGAIAGSYNVGSVTRNSAGQYGIVFSTGLADTNYAVVGTAEDVTLLPIVKVSSKTTSQINLSTLNISGTGIDPTKVFVACYGDL